MDTAPDPTQRTDMTHARSSSTLVISDAFQSLGQQRLAADGSITRTILADADNSQVARQPPTVMTSQIQ